MGKISLKKYGFVKSPEDNFSDDGNYFFVFYIFKQGWKVAGWPLLKRRSIREIINSYRQNRHNSHKESFN